MNRGKLDITLFYILMLGAAFCLIMAALER